jgi:hypothetical protein
MAVQSRLMFTQQSGRANPTHEIVCRYINRTQQIQIVKIANLAHMFFERTVLPGEQLVFKASPMAELEVHSHTFITSILAKKTRCDLL